MKMTGGDEKSVARLVSHSRRPFLGRSFPVAVGQGRGKIHRGGHADSNYPPRNVAANTTTPLTFRYGLTFRYDPPDRVAEIDPDNNSIGRTDLLYINEDLPGRSSERRHKTNKQTYRRKSGN